MSNCKFYSCFKGVITCKHPKLGELNNKLAKYGGWGVGNWHPCERCKRKYKGRYPSELPKEERDWEN